MLSTLEQLNYPSLFVVNSLDPRSFLSPSSCSLLPYSTLPAFHSGQFGREIENKEPEQPPSISSRNKLGRSYNPGRPLGMMDRQRILDLYEKGHKISHIARQIGVTHSCVSKIMTRYRRTGSMFPRSYTARAKSITVDSDTSSESEGKEEEKRQSADIGMSEGTFPETTVIKNEIIYYPQLPNNTVTTLKRKTTLHTIDSILNT